jgi:molecular chaperone DnaK (HSP70)
MPAARTATSSARHWNVCIDFGTAFCKAAAAPAAAQGAFGPASVRPLGIGAGLAGENPLLLESSVFIEEGVVLFGAAATAAATARAAEKRQALRSFKTLLSAPALRQALDAPLPASIDPGRQFRQRDLIVLFLSRLAHAIKRAIAQDPTLAGVETRLRYSLPAWRGAQASHAQVKALFQQAFVLESMLGDSLRAASGVPVTRALEALEAARVEASVGAAPSIAMIYEATAAAYSAVGASTSVRCLSVIDMGAGTTDFAALGGPVGAPQEISEARATLTQAGDLIDRILLDLALEKFPELQKRSERAELWRSLLGSIRETKESLFVDGRAALTYKGKAAVITLKELTADRDFKAFMKELRKGFEKSLTVAAEHAARAKQKEVAVLAVGGGAGAPFIQDMLRKAKAPKVKTRIIPSTPDWAHDPVYRNNLAPVFPQLAIAMGGALAPESLLAAAS